MTFGQRLRLLRDLAGYGSDAALEDAAGLARGDFSRWAKDEYRPGAANRALLARVLGVDLETLDGEGEGWQSIARRQEVIRRARTAPDEEITRALTVLSVTAGPWRVYSTSTGKGITVTAEFYTAYVVRKGEQFETIFGAQYDGAAWSESHVNSRRTFKTEARRARAARAYVAENAPRAAT